MSDDTAKICVEYGTVLVSRIKSDKGNQNISGNISGNIAFRGGNWFLEIDSLRAGKISPSQGGGGGAVGRETGLWPRG